MELTTCNIKLFAYVKYFKHENYFACSLLSHFTMNHTCYVTCLEDWVVTEELEGVPCSGHVRFHRLSLLVCETPLGKVIHAAHPYLEPPADHMTNSLCKLIIALFLYVKKLNYFSLVTYNLQD